ncbi:MAG: YraN family protein [Candidatus Omnitrophica bacterium]|nr:YraN family protein [Candidatus Omnitrophota bacterium]MDD5437217.1 YraN family protein [Candidatus Omnitrophota bacterium]
MGREKKLVGEAGEAAAVRFLKKRGYRILETNARTIFGEIDIVARKDGFTIFVEVRSRSTSSLGPPYLSITKTKERHIIKNALAFLKWRKAVGSCWRIDVVSVKLDRNSKVENIELFENAVEDNGGRY